MIDRYTRPVLSQLWSDARRYETWLRVELAACEAMEAAGHRARRAPRRSSAPRAAGKLDAPRILEIEDHARATTSSPS